MKSESMTKIQPLQQWVMKLVRILRTLIFIAVILLSAKVAFADGVQTFSMDLPNAGPYDLASLVVARYRYSCSSLTAGCGSLNITTTVPTGLNYVSSAVPTVMNASYDAGTKTVVLSDSSANVGSSDVTNQACSDVANSYRNLRTCGLATHGFSTAALTMTFQKFPSYNSPIPSTGARNYGIFKVSYL